MFKKNQEKQLNKQQKSLATTFALNSGTVGLLLICQLLNLSVVSTELTFWMIGLIVLSLVWRLLIIIGNKKVIMITNRWSLTFFAIGGCIAIGSVAKELGLLGAMLHLLSFAYAIKALELKRKNDFYQLILLGLFLLATSLIFNQSLIFSTFVLMILMGNLAVLLQHYSPTQKLKQNLITSGKLILQSLPLAVVLFVVFPRLAPFWQVPLAKSAVTGLSDIVSPGDIANLARSNELAFRVTFDDKVPSYSQLYWRALVLDSFNGKSWQKSQNSKNRARRTPSQQVTYKDNVPDNAKLLTKVSYQIIAQPSFQHWLFALDVAQIGIEQKSNSSIVELSDYTLQAREPLSQTLSYNVNSYLTAPLDLLLKDDVKQQNLSYPKNSNPRLTSEAYRLRQLYSDDLELAQAVLVNFRQQQFYYTLKPPVLFTSPLDQFYFDSKQGFCAHYASAFTYLMRAAGIPARMVTGYMGGEYNPNGNYYSIYQYEAHAWSEIWLEGVGWYRVDPTSAVDPARVERGLSSELLQQQASFNDSFFNFSGYRNSALGKAIRLQFEAIDYRWTRWVIGYSSDRQYNLLSKWFGQMKPWKTAVIIALSMMAMIILILLFKLLSKRRVNNNNNPLWLDLYQQGLTLLSSKGIDKPISMSASDFIVVVSQNMPTIKQNFIVFTQCFIQLNYQNLSEKEQKNYLTKMQSTLLTIKQQVKL